MKILLFGFVEQYSTLYLPLYTDLFLRVSPHPRRPPPAYDAEQYKLHYRKGNGKPPMSSMWVTDSSSSYSRWGYTLQTPDIYPMLF